MNRQILFLTLCLMQTQIAHAFFCPTNFNQIDIGNSQQQIDQVCGKAVTVTEVERMPPDNSPQEWSYFVTVPPRLGESVAGSIKATVAFDQNGKAINITVNGLSVNTTTLCDRTIVIGTTRDALKSACGTPAYVNRAAGSNPPTPVKQIEYRYDTNPPITLIFENGILVGRK